MGMLWGWIFCFLAFIFKNVLVTFCVLPRSCTYNNSHEHHTQESVLELVGLKTRPQHPAWNSSSFFLFHLQLSPSFAREREPTCWAQPPAPPQPRGPALRVWVSGRVGEQRWAAVRASRLPSCGRRNCATKPQAEQEVGPAATSRGLEEGEPPLLPFTATDFFLKHHFFKKFQIHQYLKLGPPVNTWVRHSSWVMVRVTLSTQPRWQAAAG